MEQSEKRPCRQTKTVVPSILTNSPHPSSREGHLFHRRWSSSFLVSYLILYSPHATANSRVQWNSVPSTHMRCMITANRRASATIAFFIPRCLAIFIAQGSLATFTSRKILPVSSTMQTAGLLDRNVQSGKIVHAAGAGV